ncbi:TPA: hypothetical protein U2L31_006558 [Burkholderia contaminans]|nr:hypothetical protein [Burkholderia contaminans]
MNIKTEAIANADAQLRRAGLYTHRGVLNELRNVLEAVKAGVPESVGYGEIGKPAVAHGWTAAMEHVYGELVAARALLREVDGADHAGGGLSADVGAVLPSDARAESPAISGEALRCIPGCGRRFQPTIRTAGMCWRRDAKPRSKQCRRARTRSDTVGRSREIRGNVQFCRNTAPASQASSL